MRCVPEHVLCFSTREPAKHICFNQTKQEGYACLAAGMPSPQHRAAEEGCDWQQGRQVTAQSGTLYMVLLVCDVLPASKGKWLPRGFSWWLPALAGNVAYALGRDTEHACMCCSDTVCGWQRVGHACHHVCSSGIFCPGWSYTCGSRSSLAQSALA